MAVHVVSTEQTYLPRRSLLSLLLTAAILKYTTENNLAQSMQFKFLHEWMQYHLYTSECF